MTADTTDAAVRSGVQLIGASVGIRVALFVRSIVVARLLVPDEIGRVTLAATALGIVDQITTPGIVQALVQRRNVDEHALESAWTVLAARGVLVGGVLAVSAPLIASAVGNNDITGLVAALAAVPLVRGFAGLGPWLRSRDVEFAALARIELLGSSIEVIASITSVALLDSAWGLVVGIILGATAEVVASHRITGHRIRLRRPDAVTWDLMRFGRWVFLSNLFAYAATNGDDLVVGRYSGTADLGQYRVAYRLANAPTTEVSHVFGRIAFPTFARASERADADLERTFLAALALSAGVAGGAAALLLATAPDLVPALVGSQWEPAIVPLQLMATAGYVRAVLATGGPLFQGAGLPHLDTALQVVRAVVLLTGVALLVQDHGIRGASVASLASVVLVLPIWAIGLGRVGIRSGAAFRVVLGRLPAALVAGGIAWAVAGTIGPHLAATVAGFASGGAAWLIVVAVADRTMATSLRSLMQRVRGARKARAA
jgi:O-antigen/teichoic acid export membrane protein